MPSPAAFALTLASLTLALAVPAAGQAPDEWPHARTLEREHPDTYDLLLRIERAGGVLLGTLAGNVGGGRQVADRATAWVTSQGRAEEIAREAAEGYSVLGARAAEVIARTHAFIRNQLGILADPAVTDRRAALREAVERYLARPELALPGAAKDMDILYDHPHALAFRTQYPDLAGFLWAGHWHRLAATEPLTDLADRELRAAGLDTVASRFVSKLGHGPPPQAFPSQIPLAPAIAPGFIFLSPESAMIVDNLSMMQEVLADILAASAGTDDVAATLAEAVALFTDPARRTSTRGDWESMALQHGIFFQGGYPLAVMTKSELNGDPHAAHRSGGGPNVMPVPAN